MAEKRMFSKKIIDTDWFMDMPITTQCLYFHLSMRADDDGFVSSPQRIIRMVGASNDDYKLLIAKKFVIPFDSGVCVIKDWRINNYLRNDRYTETIYKEEKRQLSLNSNNEYECSAEVVGGGDGIPHGIPTVNPVYTYPNTNSNTNTDSNNIENKPIYSNNVAEPSKRKRFTPPTLQEVQDYCNERGNGVSAENFIDYYTANGWRVGKNPMKDWKACVRTWERTEYNRKSGTESKKGVTFYELGKERGIFKDEF